MIEFGDKMQDYENYSALCVTCSSKLVRDNIRVIEFRLNEAFLVCDKCDDNFSDDKLKELYREII